VIYADKRHFELHSLDLAPFAWHYRPLGSSLTDLAVDPTIVKIDGHQCIRARPARRFDTTLWLDPEIGYAVRRCVSGPESSPKWQIDVSYKQQPDGEWTIGKWVFVRYSGTEVLLKQVNMIRDVSHNGPVRSEAFDVAFPEDALIIDVRSRR
jgi:hypothetical protein